MTREPRLQVGEVQVWRVDAAATVQRCWPLLLPDEVTRARSIRASVAQQEFVAGRGALRLLLARELRCVANEVRLGVGAQGKLMVEGIQFNVAHSRGVVLIALSQAGAVGVDIEHEDREVEALEIARGSFHPEEIAWVEREGVAAFYRCWTRKEAVVKADGRGLLVPLRSFSVASKGDFECEEVVDLTSEENQDGYQRRQICYYVRNVAAGEGMVASLALAQPKALVTLHSLAETTCEKLEASRLGLRGEGSFLLRVTP